MKMKEQPWAERIYPGVFDADLSVMVDEVHGILLRAPRGHNGFGYDPLFFLPNLNCTMAELDLETKLSLSHRGRALRSLLTKLGI